MTMDMSAVIEGTTPLKCWNNAITSISKIGENVSFEVTPQKLLLACFNASESVLATMELSKSFFRHYKMNLAIDSSRSKRAKFSNAGFTARFQLQSKVLMSIFKRIDKDSNIIQKCKLTFLDAYEDVSDDTSDLRITSMNVEIVLQNGMSKIYQTPCIDAEQIYRGAIDKESVTSWFKVDAGIVKSCLVHASYRAEEMDICFDEQRVELATITRAVLSDKEILKQPLQTRVSISLDQFDSMDVKVGAHISFRFKEFGIMMNLAESLSTSGNFASTTSTYVKGLIAKPGLPMLFELNGKLIPESVDLRFMFMTNAEEEEDEETPELETRRIEKNSHDTTVSIKSSVAKLKAKSTEVSTSVEMDDQADEASVTWDTGERTEPISIDMGSEDEDQEFNAEILAFSQRMDNLDEAVLGPTQGGSQAKGLFD